MYLLIVLLSMAVAVGVDARPDRGQRGEGMMEALGLSDEQRVHIEKLREAHRKEMWALSMSGARPDLDAMERLFDVHQRQIAKTLMHEQREQMERGHRRRDRGGPDRSTMGRRGDRGPGGSTMRGPGKPFAQLDLSNEQSVKLNDAYGITARGDAGVCERASRGYRKRIDEGAASLVGRN